MNVTDIRTYVHMYVHGTVIESLWQKWLNRSVLTLRVSCQLCTVQSIALLYYCNILLLDILLLQHQRGYDNVADVSTVLLRSSSG